MFHSARTKAIKNIFLKRYAVWGWRKFIGQLCVGQRFRFCPSSSSFKCSLKRLSRNHVIIFFRLRVVAMKTDATTDAMPCNIKHTVRTDACAEHKHRVLSYYRIILYYNILYTIHTHRIMFGGFDGHIVTTTTTEHATEYLQREPV